MNNQEWRRGLQMSDEELDRLYQMSEMQKPEPGKQTIAWGFVIGCGLCAASTLFVGWCVWRVASLVVSKLQ